MNRKSLAGILVGLGVLIGLGAVSCSVGVFDEWLGRAGDDARREQASVPQSTPLPATNGNSGVQPAPGSSQQTNPVATETAPASAEPAQSSAGTDAPVAEQGDQQREAASPAFDVVRVEPNGSLVIAGMAGPNAAVSLLSGSRELAQVKADATGSFAVVLDDPLKPGDYQLVLRATGEDGSVMMSGQTAVVAVPENSQGDVLALVEQPGAPSRLITLPEKPAETVQEQETRAETEPTRETSPAQAQSGKPAPITVQAVEIEGDHIFIAGQGLVDKRVRVHANDILLGQTSVDAEGRYLVESRRDLPVGDYIIRAELLEPNGRDVIGRATVPFRRVAGENIAATAPAGQGQGQAGEANALQAVDGSVIIRRGDTLWHISRRVYGRGTRYTTIYLANQEAIRNPNLILPGQVFSVPERSQEGEAANLEILRERAQSR
ncbi:LysM peptidoglycan-binding domain-containing protein [Limoniibacter endophyticus]|uniref:Peptidoglycan-binding protein LysM n=1 Tax=Limoniibacter endophyticus TaxID=1565040 RepID=A0A8J3GH37_9HYPH|nr:LysM peptidoglycan-binding domain-containing protein [Limoniibacter endophyticus]GHC68912.1 peptidoglycan-binding protein LysM [Limoniibacter endophyticus]